MGPRSIAASVRSVFSRATGNESIAASDVAAPSETSSAGSEESMDDGESMFIYQRVSNLPPTFFTHDAVSACLISSSVHALATHGGIVHLRRPNGAVIRTVRVHRASVLDIDSDGKYVATASIDGTVVIASLADQLDTVQASFKRPVHCVALHPDYRNHRAYVSGGTAGEVVLSERGWLKSRADTVLAHTQSTILACSWVSAPSSTESRVVWCNEEGVTIYCPERRAVLSRIPRAAVSPRADLYRPRIYVSEGHAIVAWARSVYNIELHRGSLTSQLEFPYMLSGAVPFKSMLALLTVDPHSCAAELKLRGEDGQEVYADELELHTNQKIGSNDFHLAIESGKVYIVSSNDAIVARERTPRDHVDWLFERERFVEAYSLIRRAISGPEDKRAQEDFNTAFTRDVGLKAAQQLVDSKSYTQAAHILSEILEPKDNEWLLWSNQFLSAKQHLLWGDTLPVEKVGDVHDDILAFAVENNCSTQLKRWISQWPLDIYDGPKLTEKLAQSNSTFLLPVYADLQLKLGEYVPAVQALVKADSSRAFSVVRHFHLWSEPPIVEILDSILSAGHGDDGDGGYVARLRELIAVRAEIAPSKVVHRLQLGDNDLLLFGYLSELGLVDETQLANFADIMVRLYIRYDSKKLLGFLERFDTYNLDETLQLCRKHRLTSELVYLLGRVGHTEEALSLIVTDLKDYARATAFAASLARSQGSTEVWDHLVQYCRSEPQLVLELLKRSEVSPAKVLAVVPAQMRITGLKQALCDVLREQDTSLSLADGTLGIVSSESKFWTGALRAKRVEGTLVDEEAANSEKPPLLIGSEGVVAVPEFTKPIHSFGTKIAHLRAIYN